MFFTFSGDNILCGWIDAYTVCLLCFISCISLEIIRILSYWLCILYLGFGLFVSQVTLYPLVERFLGPVMICRIAGVCSQYLVTFSAISSFQLLSCSVFTYFKIFVGLVHTFVGELPFNSHAFWVHPLSGVELCICAKECSICEWIYNLKVLFPC